MVRHRRLGHGRSVGFGTCREFQRLYLRAPCLVHVGIPGPETEALVERRPWHARCVIRRGRTPNERCYNLLLVGVVLVAGLQVTEHDHLVLGRGDP